MNSTFTFFLDGLSLEDEIDGFPETSVTKYKYTVRNIPEERNSRLRRGGSLKLTKQRHRLRVRRGV
jgi:hypothetical protein